ncbi:hypothetical protein [Roseibium litorale]|uniref:DUF1843 domain-containing protein n=1 Tax=Roseibium litorale TaxID=2803841 RepID=A0ABR9CTF4_9HYPH|nr:hypothetical protein [Roseibium litorale]MBD8894018.1 hypothetical protein [Roseibium litorale]
MHSAAAISREQLERAVKALAVAALHHGREAEMAFERILKIQDEYNQRESLLEKARQIAAIGCTDDARP